MRSYTALILPDLEEFLREDDDGHARVAVEGLLPADVADICEHLETPQAARLLTVLPLESATEVLEHLEPERQVELIESIGRERLVRMLDQMNPDDRADLVRQMPDAAVEMLLPLLAQAERNDLKRLLAYPEETAGALMTTEYVWLKKNLTADEALQKLRKVAPDSETIYYVYVVDDARRLEGVVSLREIICAPPKRPLAALMTEHPITCPVDEDQEEVARLFEKYDLQALPVTERETGRLVGIITFDDVLDVIEDEATEDVQMLGGLAPLDESYMRSTIAHLVRKRVVWLVILLAAQNLAALAIDYNKGMVSATLFLLVIPFMPLVNSSGGNAGSQSATLITRALATGDIALADALRVILREAASGLLLGVLMSGVGLGATLLFGQAFAVAGVVALSIFCVVVFGAFLGTVIPLGLHLVGLDPAVASAPLIASLSDVVGISTFLILARTLLQ